MGVEGEPTPATVSAETPLPTEQAPSPEMPQRYALAHTNSVELIRKDPPHHHDDIDPPTFKVGRPGQEDGNLVAPAQCTNNSTQEGMLSHVDSVDLLRQHPPHQHDSIDPPTFKAGTYEDDVSSPMQASSDGCGLMRHVDSAELLRDYRKTHPPQQRLSPLRPPPSFQVGAPQLSPLGAPPQTAAEGSGEQVPVGVESFQVGDKRPSLALEDDLAPMALNRSASVHSEAMPQAEEDQEDPPASNISAEVPMSKNQQKKLLKQQR
mmetsp:Transcript_25706/g.71928  ORF Transcript_25706/g.71928 Transcript_25706/m.71928 type:complete len:264 (+) Transcript_25706:145-936(+)